MIHLELDISRLMPFVSGEELRQLQQELIGHHQVLISKTGPGKEFLGWIDLPDQIDNNLISRIITDANNIREKAEIVVVVGIGGSYLGAKSVIEALKPHFDYLNDDRKGPQIVYAGNNISEDYLAELIHVLDKKSYAVIVISKSGKTTESAIAFRFLRQNLEAKYGKTEAATRIIAITDGKRGALKSMANLEGYITYEIPDDVGGRFSVLTPVGLLPIAIAGFNIKELLDGARNMAKYCKASAKIEENIAIRYVVMRNIMYRNGKPLEMMVNYEPALTFFTEWWKQLFGESEGKQHRGIFPTGANFTCDLHSMGQYLQDGMRVLFETVISVGKPKLALVIPNDPDNYDGLNFIAGREIHEVNKMAELGTMLAHVDGGVPVMTLKLPELTELFIGEMIYFFEFACALSGYVLEVNPFDQPGVEAYKKNMFALLGKPGYEEETKSLRNRLNQE